MASARPIESTPVQDPVLGPAVLIYADRRRSFGMIFLYLAFIAISVVGVILGIGDLTGRDNGTATLGIPGPVVGLAQIAAAVIVSTWSVRATIFAIGRIRQPITFVVGRDGFEYVGGHGPVLWNEVASVSDPASPPDQPRMLRVQLIDPDDYVARHALWPVARMLLRAHHFDLFLGRDTVMPTGAVQALMRKRLAKYRQTRHDGSAAPATAAVSPAPRAPRRTRASRKR